jgi:hypothetical protein
MKEAAAAADDDDAQNLHNFPSLVGGGLLCVVWVFCVFFSLTSLK